MSTIYAIDGEAAISSVLATTEFPCFDLGGSARTKKATAAQLAAYLAGGAELFGGGTATMGGEGNINVQTSAAGINPGATAADNVLAFYTIPASSFSAAGKLVNFSAYGSLVSNTNTKTIKIIVGPSTAVVGSTVGTGGTTVATLTSATTAGSGGWNIGAQILKYGAAGSNTQLALHEAAQSGNLISALTAPSSLTLTESGAVLVAITGNAATTATDIVFNTLVVNACN